MRYNYFDDDEQNEARESAANELLDRIKARLNPRSLAANARMVVDDMIHGEAVEELREMPNVKSILLKLLAFVLFILFIIIFIFSFSHTIQSQSKEINRFNADAGKVCTDIITKYGSVKWERLESKTYGKDKARLTGLCYARQMDFDNDSSPELMVCYNNGNVYTLEVYSYVDKKFSKVYSEEANSTNNIKDGSWIGFYYKNNKYYICKSEKDSPEKIELFAFKGDKFKKINSTCDYDYKNDIYSVKGKINAEDFETIKLSVIKSSKAERTTDLVTETLEGFSSVSLTDFESKSSYQLKMDAYYEIIEKRIAQHGKAEVKTENNSYYINGLAYVDLIDFNKDDNEELVIAYRKNVRKSATDYYTGDFIVIEEPVYCMEVYSWNGTIASKIFSKESVCNYLDDDTVNYVMIHKTDKLAEICSNYYNKQTSYNYSASSKIYRLKKNKFDLVYNVRMDYDYGYKEYYIDGEYSYSSKFEEEGYKVPLFLNDKGNYDSEKYIVTYLSGKKNYDYNAVVQKTVKTIQKINNNYSPD